MTKQIRKTIDVLVFTQEDIKELELVDYGWLGEAKVFGLGDMRYLCKQVADKMEYEIIWAYNMK